MTHLIEVAFGGNRKAFYLWDGEAPPPLQAPVIVEADRGEDLGRVHAVGELAERRCAGCSHGCGTTSRPSERALRIASAAELARAATLREENEVARRTTHERTRAAGLVMKISDAEWQWDRRKLTIYFTAEKRVDFRNLVRELAAHFRARIELRQIGVRDEAKRLSGIGRCGREYCSASWLPDLRPVNLGVAKDQRLSLNPTQISGACGRLMCCLRYEHDFYVQSRRRFPKEGRILRTSRGEEKVVAIDIFCDTVTLRSVEGDTRVVALVELRTEAEQAGSIGLLGGAPGTGERVALSDADDTVDTGDTGDTGDTVDTVEADVALEATADADVALETTAGTNAATPAMRATAPASAAPDDAADAADAEEDGDPSDDDDALTDASPAGTSPAGTSPAGASPAGADDAPRRKRRRGRRGGRRVRGERPPRDDGPTPPAPPAAPDT